MSSQPKRMFSAVSALALVLTAWMARSPGVVADEAQARRLLKAMTDYVGAQQAIAFDYDATLEVVTKDRQKLELASSGTVSLARPDKIRTTRSGGFVDIETVFDGKTLTFLGKNKNVYTQVEVPGSLDQPGERAAEEVRPAPARGRSVPHQCLRRADGRRDGRQGSGQRGHRRHRVRLPRLPHQRGGLADLDCAGREVRIRAGTSSRPRKSPTGRSTPSSFGTGRPAARSPRRTSRSSRRPARGRLTSTSSRR